MTFRHARFMIGSIIAARKMQNPHCGVNKDLILRCIAACPVFDQLLRLLSLFLWPVGTFCWANYQQKSVILYIAKRMVISHRAFLLFVKSSAFSRMASHSDVSLCLCARRGLLKNVNLCAWAFKNVLIFFKKKKKVHKSLRRCLDSTVFFLAPNYVILYGCYK